MAEENYRHLKEDTEKVTQITELNRQIGMEEKRLQNTVQYTQQSIDIILDILHQRDFICIDQVNGGYSLTERGKIASVLQEVHSLAFADMFVSPSGNLFNELSAEQLVGFFSCLANIRCDTCVVQPVPKTPDTLLESKINQMYELYCTYSHIEDKQKIDSGLDYNLQFDFIESMSRWCVCPDEESCKAIIDHARREKNIYLGEFIKAILKINNIASEFEKVCELTGNVALLSKIQKIPEMTLKFVATNQSLYV